MGDSEAEGTDHRGGYEMITQAPRGVEDWYGERMHKRAWVSPCWTGDLKLLASTPG